MYSAIAAEIVKNTNAIMAFGIVKLVSSAVLVASAPLHFLHCLSVGTVLVSKLYHTSAHNKQQDDTQQQLEALRQWQMGCRYDQNFMMIIELCSSQSLNERHADLEMKKPLQTLQSNNS